MPLDPERRAIYDRLRALDPAKLTASEARLLEDLMHQEGASGIEQAIEAGSGQGGVVASNICGHCGEASIEVRTVFNGVIRRCVLCHKSSRAPAAPSVTNATPRAHPDPVPTVHMDPNVDYLPDRPPGFRHPGKNYRPEDT